MRIHKDLSELIYYVRSVSFHSFEDAKKNAYYCMSSFSEKKAFQYALERLPRGGAEVEKKNIVSFHIFKL